MTFEVINTERATQNFPKRTSIVAVFDTKAEAEAWRNREDPSGDISSGIRETPEVKKPTLETGEEFEGEALGKPAFKDTRQRDKLAKQAQEKAAAGEQISAAERQAFRRSRFEVTDPETGEKTTKTGAQLGIQTPAEAAEIGAKKRGEEVISKTKLEQIKAEERQKRVRATTERIASARAIDVPFSPAAFQRAEQVLAAPTGAGQILSEPELLEETRETLETKRIAKIIPETPFEEQKVKEILVPLEKPKPGEFIVSPVTPKERRAIDVTPSDFKDFEQRVKEQTKRQEEFFESPGFQRIEKVAGRLTLGFGKPLEERTLPGKVAQLTVAGFAGFPIALGGGISLAAEKIGLTGEALAFGKREVPGGFVQVRRTDITGELGEAFPRTIKQFRELPLEEKLATGVFVATAPFLGGGPVRRFFGRRVTRAKAIKELKPAERAKLERFELSVEELKGVRLKPKKINLAEVERLSPKAAKALERVILRKKEDIVVGGSVAQRTQIKGVSRIPEDIDLFVRGDKKIILKEIATELKEAGVERVSVVRGKLITIGGKKAIEVKELSLLKQNIQKIQLPFQPFSSALARTPRGVRVLRLGAQAQRKVVGGFGLERERIRAKDVTDLPSILKSLRAGKKASASFIPVRQPKPFTPIFPIGLKGEPSSLLKGRRGEPSVLGGISDISNITRSVGLPSVVKPSPLRPSPPSRITPSVLRPTPTPQSPSLITPFDVSGITPAPAPTPAPSQISPLRPQPTTPSLLEPVRPTPTPKRRAFPKIKIDSMARTFPAKGFDTFYRKERNKVGS